MERHRFVSDAGEEAQAAGPVTPRTVLIAEDDEDLLELFAAAFEDAGFQVLRTTDGKALEKMAGDRPDAIITDLLLPGQSGLAAVRRIRASGFDGPVFLISGLPLDGNHPDYRVCSEYIRKPVRPDDLIARVRTHLAERAAAATTE